MCGIVGYIGTKEARPLLLDGIKTLEYRGYDSAGIAVLGADGAVKSEKAVGKVLNLERKLEGSPFPGSLGIIHSRWATHGGVTEKNAHPHSDCSGSVWLVHNGIIENYQELKDELTRQGHTFASETDTEVLPHLIEESKKMREFSEAVRSSLKKIRGTYGLVVISSDAPNTLIAARNFSPLVIGIGSNEYIVASDPSAILKQTKKVVYLDDGEMAVINRGEHKVFDLGLNLQKKEVHEIDWTLEQARLGNFPHFMLKEIFEEPEAVENSIRGRLIPEDGLAKLGGLNSIEKNLKSIDRIIIAASGTARLAGVCGEYMLEEYAGLSVEVEYGSEFRYRKPVLTPNTALLAISQSGESADTLAAVREAKRRGLLTIGVVNVVGSSIARETAAGIYTHAGPEIAVASTKALMAQIATMVLLTLFLGRQRGTSLVTGQRIAKELTNVPDLIRTALQLAETIKTIAAKYQRYENFFFLGRKYNYPVALEGDIKLKELSYVHSEGYPLGEMKHGPIAMIDEDFPSICIVPSDSVYEKSVSNIQEIKARGGPVIAIATEGNTNIKNMVDDVVYIPKTLEMLTPLLATVPLHLFAYYFAAQKGLDVDKPRNLAKSVTVE